LAIDGFELANCPGSGDLNLKDGFFRVFGEHLNITPQLDKLSLAPEFHLAP
jgi:hypothetical protein